MDDDTYLRRAHEQGEDAFQRGDYPAGCVIVKNKEVVVEAGSTAATDQNPTAHDTINALRQASKRGMTANVEDATFYGNIEPCLMCGKALVYAGVDRVVYGTPHQEYGDDRTFDVLHQHGIGTGITVEHRELLAARQLLETYRAKENV